MPCNLENVDRANDTTFKTLEPRPTNSFNSPELQSYALYASQTFNKHPPGRVVSPWNHAVGGQRARATLCRLRPRPALPQPPQEQSWNLQQFVTDNRAGPRLKSPYTHSSWGLIKYIWCMVGKAGCRNYHSPPNPEGKRSSRTSPQKLGALPCLHQLPHRIGSQDRDHFVITHHPRIGSLSAKYYFHLTFCETSILCAVMNLDSEGGHNIGSGVLYKADE